jgi:hypothetical protein
MPTSEKRPSWKEGDQTRQTEKIRADLIRKSFTGDSDQVDNSFEMPRSDKLTNSVVVTRGSEGTANMHFPNPEDDSDFDYVDLKRIRRQTHESLKRSADLTKMDGFGKKLL